MTYLSTDCSDDLSLRTCALVRFEKPSADTQAPPPRALTYQHQWFVGSKSGCSCTFRHLSGDSVNLDFGEPEDWFPEDAEAVEATKRLYSILEELLGRGYRIDLLDCWSGNEDKEAVPLDVSLAQVPVSRFRLFEGRLFRLRR